MTQFNTVLSWPSSETEKAWEMGREWEEGKRDAGEQNKHWEKKRKKTVIIYKCYEVENIKESRDKLLTLPSVLDTKSKKYITFLYISS